MKRDRGSLTMQTARPPQRAEDLRGITPLIYGHVDPYGSFLLDLHSHLPIDPPRFGSQSVGTQMLLGYDQLTGGELLCGS